MKRFKSGTLESYFADIRNGKAEAQWVFSKIQNRELEDSDISEDISDRPNKKDIFISRYIIALVMDYADYKDADVLLEMCGYLEGYEEINITNRRTKYCANVGIYNEKTKKEQILAEYWGSIRSNMINRENGAIERLVDKINKRTSNINYIDKANELIKESYPTPNYLRGEGYGYRKCEVDGKVFYIPLTEKERRTAANILSTTTQDGGSDEESMGAPADSPLDSLPDDPSDVATWCKRLTKIIMRIMDCIQKYIVILFKGIIGVLIIIFLIVTIRCIWRVGDFFEDINNPKDKTYKYIESAESSEVPVFPIDGLDLTTE